MRLPFPCFLAFVIYATSAHADPIKVRAGEHEAFTRVVLDISESAAWSLSSSGSATVLSLEKHSEGFDLSEAFRIIPRTRLSALVGRASELELQLACNCSVDAFLEQGRFLVLDIAESTNDSDQIASIIPTSPILTSRFGYGDLLWSGTGPTPSKTGDNDLEAETSVQKPSSDIDTFMDETRRRLVEAFSDAASKGILDSEIIENRQAEKEIPQDIETQIYDSSIDNKQNKTEQNGNLRISNSNDMNPNPISNLSILGASCIEPHLVDVASWGSDLGFGEQMSKAYAAIHNDAGKLQEKEVVKLAKLYLFFGFGAEAKNTLELIPNSTLDYPELIDISNILEFGFAGNPRSVHRFPDCPSDVALWAILAAQKPSADIAVAGDAAIQALEKLPDHLKLALADQLSEQLIKRGDVERAKIALRSQERLILDNSPSPSLAQAQIAASQNEGEAQIGILTSLASQGSDDGPEALVSLIGQMANEEREIPADLALLAEAYATELRNTDMYSDIQLTYVFASAGSKQFDKAFSAAGEYIIENDDKKHEIALSYIFKEIAEDADDSQFLVQVFARRSLLESVPTATSKQIVAQRLLDLGFATDARQILSTIPRSETTELVDVLIGKTMLVDGLYREALEQVRESDGPDTLLIRAKAFLALEQNSEAATNFQAVNLDAEAIRSLWLDPDWARLLAPDEPVFGPASALSTAPPNLIGQNETLLSDASTILNASDGARKVIEALLEKVQVSE